MGLVYVQEGRGVALDGRGSGVDPVVGISRPPFGGGGPSDGTIGWTTRGERRDCLPVPVRVVGVKVLLPQRTPEGRSVTPSTFGGVRLGVRNPDGVCPSLSVAWPPDPEVVTDA